MVARQVATPIVGQGGGPPGQEVLYHGAMDGEDEGAGGALQGAQEARPRGEFVGSLNGRRKARARAAVPVLNG